ELRRGWIHCSHSHCANRTQDEWLAALPEAAKRQAREQLAPPPPRDEDAPPPHQGDDDQHDGSGGEVGLDDYLAAGHTVEELLARVAECLRRLARDANMPVPPPKEVVEDLIALGEWPALPPLEAVTEVPVLRADGSVLDRPGYDPATRLVYAPTPSLVVPSVP